MGDGWPAVFAEQRRSALDASSDQRIRPVSPVQVLAEAEAGRVASADARLTAVGSGARTCYISTCGENEWVREN